MYTSTANIAARLGTSLTDEQANYYNYVLADAIQALIDKETETSFNTNQAVSVYCSGDGSATLSIPTMHDITEIVKVSNDDTEEAVAVDDYRTCPRGSVNKLAVKNLNGTWAEGTDNYKVSGKLGWSEIPADITSIATEMAVSALSANINNFKSEKTGDYSVVYGDSQPTISPDSLSVLRSYRRLSRSI